MEANLGVGFSYEEVFEMCQAGRQGRTRPSRGPEIFPSLHYHFISFHLCLPGLSRKSPSWRERSEAGLPCPKCPQFPWTPTSTMSLIWRRLWLILMPWGKGYGSELRCLWCLGTRSQCQNCQRTRARCWGTELDSRALSLSEVIGTDNSRDLFQSSIRRYSLEFLWTLITTCLDKFAPQ